MTLTPMQEKAKKFCEALLEKYKGNEPFKGEDGEYHYIYLTILKHNHKFYIGKHSSKDYTIDPYTGSGRWYKNALKHHGIDAIQHYPLCFFPTSDEAYAKEAEEVTLEMIENTFKGQIYNLQSGGLGGVKQSKERKNRQAQAIRENTRYTLKKGGEPPLGFTRYEVLGKLKEGYRFTQVTVTICNKDGKYKTHRFESKHYKYDREKQHLKLIGLLERGLWQIGKKWEKPEEVFLIVGKEELNIYLTEGKSEGTIWVTKGGQDKRVYPEELDIYFKEGFLKGKKNSYKVLMDKERKEHSTYKTEILGKLQEGYRFTQRHIKICNKEGKSISYPFEDKRCKYDIDERHLKLISMLESGDWQIGTEWV